MADTPDDRKEMAGMDGTDAARAADLMSGNALDQVRALAEVMFRKGLITPDELDGVRASRARREMARERMWAGLIERAVTDG